VSYCKLFQHSWSTFAGHGQYAGQTFQVCTRCNKTHAGPPQVSDASTPFLIEMDAPVLEYPTVAE
jgi:hypothetical protein